MHAEQAVLTDDHHEPQLAALTLEEKVRLLTGATAWTLHPLPSIGLRAVAVSDGPAGVRGVSNDPTETAALFPSPTALGATWDEALAERVGALFATEARRHGVDVVLMPVLNLQRTPVAGRHFEYLSEDPLLTGRLAGALVTAVQAGGVGACAKHFVANDSETDRTSYVARVGERVLRELYLAPFEHVVREAGVWTVMAAYSGLDDGVESSTATEHRRLLHDLLKQEWGFDGVVVSDWLAARSTVATASAGLDLVMPGPHGPWKEALLEAVRTGQVDVRVVDDKVRRILRLARRVGAFDPAPAVATTPAGPLLREVAARSVVVVKDDRRQLPVDPPSLRSVALIGPNAVDAFVQGGGSAHVRPDHVVTPAEGLRAALPEDTRLTVCRGGSARPHPPELELDGRALDPDTGDPGVRVTFLDGHGHPLGSQVHRAWTGWLRDVPDTAAAARFTTRVTLREPGTHWLGVGTVGVYETRIDGHLVGAGTDRADAAVVLDSSVNAPDTDGQAIRVDTPRHVEVDATLQVVDADGYGRFVRAALRHRLPGPSVTDEIAEAVAAARDADLAVVVVGTNSEVESEGWDRTGLELPGHQNELVRRVAEVNPRTVVVVNAGSPVLLPWLEEVGTVLWSWFPGQECGHALADVLLGRTEPSGRLPWTLPARAGDVPVPDAVPRDGVVEYHEGVHIGYRGWLERGATPAAPFGHGLGWTDWAYDAVRVLDPDDQGLQVEVEVRNVGPRAGREVVQVYLEAPEGGPERPVRWLAGFTVVDAAPGQPVTARLRVAWRSFQIWEVATHGWITPPGRYHLHAGRSVADLRLSAGVVPAGTS